MTIPCNVAFGVAAAGLPFVAVNDAGETIGSGTLDLGGGGTVTVTAEYGDRVRFWRDGDPTIQAGPITLDPPVSDAIMAINALGTGTGARTLTFTVQDADFTPVEHATVRVTAGIITKHDLTDVNGIVEIPVDDGTWHFAVDKSGYDGVTGSRIVAGDLPIAATLSAVVVPLPADPGLVTVYGAYGFLNIYEADISVTASIKGNGNVFLSNTLQNTDRTASTTTGAGGIWSLDLAPLPDGFFWELSIGSKKLRIVVPNFPNTSVDVVTILEQG